MRLCIVLRQFFVVSQCFPYEKLHTIGRVKNLVQLHKNQCGVIEMANIQVQQIGNEPIIHAKITGFVDIDVLLEVYQRTAELRQNMPKNIYRITEVTDVESSFSEMMEVIREAAKRGGSSSTDPTVTVVFIGTSHWVKLFTDALRQGAFGGRQIPVFEDFDSAISYVRSDIAAKADEE